MDVWGSGAKASRPWPSTYWRLFQVERKGENMSVLLMVVCFLMAATQIPYFPHPFNAAVFGFALGVGLMHGKDALVEKLQ